MKIKAWFLLHWVAQQCSLRRAALVLQHDKCRAPPAAPTSVESLTAKAIAL